LEVQEIGSRIQPPGANQLGNPTRNASWAIERDEGLETGLTGAKAKMGVRRSMAASVARSTICYRSSVSTFARWSAMTNFFLPLFGRRQIISRKHTAKPNHEEVGIANIVMTTWQVFPILNIDRWNRDPPAMLKVIRPNLSHKLETAFRVSSTD
jgi:hypothetical protein